MDCLRAVSFNTFGGNPIAATAGSAVLDYVLSHDLQANAARVGGLLHTGVRAIGSPRIAQVRRGEGGVGIETGRFWRVVGKAAYWWAKAACWAT